MRLGGLKGTAFDGETARRVLRATRVIEGGSLQLGGAAVTSAGDDADAVLCKTTSAWPKNTSATLQIWAGQPFAETYTGVTLVAHNRYAAIATAKFCTVMLHRHGYYYVIAAECA